MLLSLFFIVNCTQPLKKQNFQNYKGYKCYSDMTDEQKAAEFCLSLMYCIRMTNGPYKIYKNILSLEFTYSKYWTVQKKKLHNNNILILFVEHIRESILDILDMVYNADDDKHKEDIKLLFSSAIKKLKTVDIDDPELHNMIDALWNDDNNERYKRVILIAREICILIEEYTTDMLEERKIIYDIYCTKSDHIQIDYSEDELSSERNVELRNGNIYHNVYKDTGQIMENVTYIYFSTHRYCIDLFTLLKTKLRNVQYTDERDHFEQIKAILLEVYRYNLQRIQWYEMNVIQRAEKLCVMLTFVMPFQNAYEELLRRNLFEDSFYFHVMNYIEKDDFYDVIIRSYCVFIFAEMIRVFSRAKITDGQIKYLRLLEPNIYASLHSNVYNIQNNQTLIF